MTRDEAILALRARGWREPCEGVLTNPKVPDLQYVINRTHLIEQRCIKGKWWLATGWTFGRFTIDRHGAFKRH